MALHLRARTLDAQIFGAQVEGLAVIESDGQRLAVLVQTQFGRPRLRRCVAHVDLLLQESIRREIRPRWPRPIAGEAEPQRTPKRPSRRLSRDLIFCLHNAQNNRTGRPWEADWSQANSARGDSQMQTRSGGMHAFLAMC